MKHIAITIIGKVQGVGFRNSAYQHAISHGLKGYVRNKPDKSVYIEAESDNDLALELFIAWCKQGPTRARIDQVHIYEDTPKGYQDFQIR